jgi:hypothetical protein
MGSLGDWIFIWWELSIDLIFDIGVDSSDMFWKALGQ